MLTQLLSLVLLVGLTATTLMLCLEKWGVLQAWEVKRPAWLMKRCDLCAGYWICVVLLLVVISGYLRLAKLGIEFEPNELGFLFHFSTIYTRLLLSIHIPTLLLVFPLALPAAAVCRLGFGLSTGR